MSQTANYKQIIANWPRSRFLSYSSDVFDVCGECRYSHFISARQISVNTHPVLRTPIFHIFGFGFFNRTSNVMFRNLKNRISPKRTFIHKNCKTIDHVKAGVIETNAQPDWSKPLISTIWRETCWNICPSINMEAFFLRDLLWNIREYYSDILQF